MTKITQRQLSRLSSYISEIMSLYIITNGEIKFPIANIEAYKSDSQNLYVTFKNGTNHLFGIINIQELFEDTRAMCYDWNNITGTNLKGRGFYNAP